MTAAPKTKFAVGDRVSLWNQKAVGTVVKVHPAGQPETIVVAWDKPSGRETKAPAYRFRHAAA